MLFVPGNQCLALWTMGMASPPLWKLCQDPSQTCKRGKAWCCWWWRTTCRGPGSAAWPCWRWRSHGLGKMGFPPNLQACRSAWVKFMWYKFNDKRAQNRVKAKVFLKGQQNQEWHLGFQELKDFCLPTARRAWTSTNRGPLSWGSTLNLTVLLFRNISFIILKRNFCLPWQHTLPRHQPSCVLPAAPSRLRQSHPDPGAFLSSNLDP